MARKKTKTERPLIANAGKDQIVYARYDGTASVMLDGSGSNGSKAHRLTYTWYVGDAPIAMGRRPTIRLISGEHTISLVVNNARQESEPSQVVITVLDPLEVECRIFPPCKTFFKKDPEIMATLSLPPGMTKDQINSDEPLRLYPCGTEVKHQYEIQWRRDKKARANIFVFFHKDMLKHVSPDGSAEIAISGQLRTGQYFYGTDIVQMVDRNQDAMSRVKTVLK
jgi:hypothetical protein